jgi:hypothetical protein
MAWGYNVHVPVLVRLGSFERFQPTGEHVFAHAHQASRSGAPHRSGAVVGRFIGVDVILYLDDRNWRLGGHPHRIDDRQQPNNDDTKPYETHGHFWSKIGPTVQECCPKRLTAASTPDCRQADSSIGGSLRDIGGFVIWEYTP